MTFPCRDCPDRNVGCHSSCEKYLLASKENEKVLEARRQMDRSYKYHNDVVIKNRYKRIKDQAKR